MVEENRVVYARRKSFGLWEAMWVLHCASWPFTLIPYISVAFPSDKTIQQGFPTFSFSFLLTKFILRKGPKLWCNGIKRHCMPAYMYPFLHDKSKVNQTSFIVVIHIICLIYIQIFRSLRINYFLTNFYHKN